MLKFKLGCYTLASIYKKLGPSVAEAVVVDRRAGVDRTPEVALEPEILSKSDPRIQ